MRFRSRHSVLRRVLNALPAQPASGAGLLLALLGPCAAAPAAPPAAAPPVNAPPPAAQEPITPIPPPPVMDPRRVALGEKLFHDPRLSHDGRRGCTFCHNVATTPGKVPGKLRADPDAVRDFRGAYGRPPDRAALLDALAAYERSLLTPGSRFDLWQVQDGADQPFRLAQRGPEHRPKRQRRQDGQNQVGTLPARGCPEFGLPRRDRVASEPNRQAATLAQARVTLAPVRHLVLLLGSAPAVVGRRWSACGGRHWPWMARRRPIDHKTGHSPTSPWLRHQPTNACNNAARGATLNDRPGISLASRPGRHQRHSPIAGRWGRNARLRCSGTDERCHARAVHIRVLVAARLLAAPARGISQDRLPLYLGFFQSVRNARRRGKALLGARRRPGGVANFAFSSTQ